MCAEFLPISSTVRKCVCLYFFDWNICSLFVGRYAVYSLTHIHTQAFYSLSKIRVGQKHQANMFIIDRVFECSDDEPPIERFKQG